MRHCWHSTNHLLSTFVQQWIRISLIQSNLFWSHKFHKLININILICVGIRCYEYTLPKTKQNNKTIKKIVCDLSKNQHVSVHFGFENKNQQKILVKCENTKSVNIKIKILSVFFPTRRFFQCLIPTHTVVTCSKCQKLKSNGSNSF